MESKLTYEDMIKKFEFELELEDSGIDQYFKQYIRESTNDERRRLLRFISGSPCLI